MIRAGYPAGDPYDGGFRLRGQLQEAAIIPFSTVGSDL